MVIVFSVLVAVHCDFLWATVIAFSPALLANLVWGAKVTSACRPHYNCQTGVTKSSQIREVNKGGACAWGPRRGAL